MLHCQKHFGHDNVKEQVKNCFDQATELLRTLTTGYVIGIALSYLKLEDSDDMSPSPPLPTTADGQLKYLEDVVDEVMAVAWQPPNIDRLLKDTDDIPHEEVCCGMLLDSAYIKCGKDGRCDGQLFYHESCVYSKPVKG